LASSAYPALLISLFQSTVALLAVKQVSVCIQTDTMNRSTMIKLPPLETSSSPLNAAMKGRARSSSIVKVEEIGDRSVEEVLDRSASVNLNADWVNAKGV
jgi:hypothetical protein